ncbi:hypothetical protein OIDMADRAFT_200934 [Oidiodendron maius Zn]|uniref:Uncharacterized protein n=1 Tax=Oidiodendron maius (strain Zn) TaxID=913774 RepID=A0A0C3H915_OIDMZ|nr:hypothetical protein OIDMADRAFT_200934 [Oidiodendron maius Zn]
MTSNSNAEQEEPTISLPSSPATDSEVDEREDLYAGMTDEEAWKKYLSTKYEDSSKNPMKEPLTELWGIPISDADLEKLKVGVKSRNMDDKWDVLNEDPDKDGNISIHILRSWLQEDCYVLHIVPKPNSDNDGGSAKIQSITWEGNKGGLQCDAEQAKKEAVIVSRMILKCEFETLPDYPSSVLWQSSAYKKLDAE